MWQWSLDEWFKIPFASSQSIPQHTPKSHNSICPHDADSAHFACSMKRVVLVFQDPHGLIWAMIFTMQKWFTISNLLIQNHSVPCSCSTVAVGLCIITIIISLIWDQTSVNHQFYYIYCCYDISTKPRIKYHTKEILNPITDTIPNLHGISHPLQLYVHWLIPCSQQWRGWYDYFLTEKSLVVFAIFWGWYQVFTYVLQMLLVQERLQPSLFVA